MIMRNITIGIVLIFSNQINAQETLCNMGSFQMHETAQIGCFGDFINDSTMVENNGVLFLTGTSGTQTLSGTGTFIFDSVVVNNSLDIAIQQELQIHDNINFTVGNLTTNRGSIDSQFVHFLAGSNYNGASDFSFIDGVATKSGNTAFDFPIGNTDELRLLTISSPDIGTDQFKAFYLNEDPDPVYSTSSMDLSCLNHVSRCEYWILNRTFGSATVSVGLNYGTSSCAIDELCDLLVARWDGTKWTNEGNGGIVGTTSSGTVTTGNGCGACGVPQEVSTFSPFSLGSSSINNALPVTLIDFKVNQKVTSVILLWETKSEINNDYYTIERSKDGMNWSYFNTVMGAGNTSKHSNYQLTDENPLNGVSYYRLAQTDYNGTKTHIGMESANFQTEKKYQIYPNPATNTFQIHFNEVDEYTPTRISLFTASGQLINIISIINSEEFISIDIQHLTPGVYYLHIRQSDELTIEKVVFI
jgi:hypothetical protein